MIKTMSKKQIKRFPNALKAKVALAAIKEEKTLAQIGSEFEINPFNVKAWKKQLLDNVEVVFDRENQVRDFKEQLAEERSKTDELHRQIGELSTRLNWAKKKSIEAGLPWPKFSVEDVKIMHKIDALYTEHPFYGYRRQYQELIEAGFEVGEDRVRRLMRVMDLRVFYPKKTSIPDRSHKIYPYLLRELAITAPRQVWAADISYIPMAQGFCYLVAIIDWHSRFLLSWRLSNSLDVHFCMEALNEALSRYGYPTIFNTDQGSQFTSQVFTGALLEKSIQISMDSVGRWADNIMIERFFRSIKWEDIYLKNYESVKEVRQGCEAYIQFYNSKRKHSSLSYKTPKEVYFGKNANEKMMDLISYGNVENPSGSHSVPQLRRL